MIGRLVLTAVACVDLTVLIGRYQICLVEGRDNDARRCVCKRNNSIDLDTDGQENGK